MILISLSVPAQEISSAFPYESKFQDLNGDRMHYVEEGRGDPILFLHGVPMSAYSWRNIMPHLSSSARCLAIDFMGFGKSDKPDIEYTFEQQLNYLEAFIEALELDKLTLVMTDIGGIIGIRYAMKHPEKIKGLVFMESPISDAETFYKNGGMMQRMMFGMARKNKMGYNMFVKRNMFLKMMPMLIKRKLSKEEKEQYWAPFPTEKSRLPLYAVAHVFPKKGRNAQAGDMADFLNKNSEALKNSSLPKLLLYAKPGMLTNKKVLAWAKENLPKLETQNLGKAKHLMEEDLPDEIGGAIHSWYKSLEK